MKDPIRLLHLDDDATERAELGRLARDQNPPWSITPAGGLAEARALLAVESFDVIVTEARLPGCGPCSVSGGSARSAAPSDIAETRRSRARRMAGLVELVIDDLRARPEIVPCTFIAAKEGHVEVHDAQQHEKRIGQGEERGLPSGA